MKKIKLLLFALLLVLPFTVKADMGMPELKGYEAVVSNPNGAKTYYPNYDVNTNDSSLVEQTKVLKYDEKIKVLWDQKRDGVEYSYVETEDDSYYLLMKDITPVLKDYDTYTVKDPEEFYTYKDVIMYEGPAINFKEVGKIPKGSTIKLERSVDDAWWEYTYNGKKGYIFHESGATIYGKSSGLAKKNPDKIKILIQKDDVVGYTDPYEENMPSYGVDTKKDKEKANVTIPKGTELEYELYYQQVFANYYYVTFEGTGCWISGDDIALEYSVFLIPLEDRPLYDSYGSTIKSSKKAKKDSVYKTMWIDGINTNHYARWMMTEIDRKKYWIIEDEESEKTTMLEFSYKEEVTIGKEVNAYDSDYKREAIGVVSKGTYEAYSNGYNRSVVYIPSYGYINREDIESSNVLEEPTTNVLPSNEETTKAVIKNKDKDVLTIDPMVLALSCVGGAFILALTCGAIIALIKKNKNKKAAEVVQTEAVATEVAVAEVITSETNVAPVVEETTIQSENEQQ